MAGRANVLICQYANVLISDRRSSPELTPFSDIFMQFYGLSFVDYYLFHANTQRNTGTHESKVLKTPFGHSSLDVLRKTFTAGP